MFQKTKEACVAVAPLLLLVLVWHFGMAPLEEGQLKQFLVSSVLLIAGLAIFGVGAQVGLVPFGQSLGAALPFLRRLSVILPIALMIGFVMTIAEPDVHMLATLVRPGSSVTEKLALIAIISLGMGVFMLAGIARVFFQLPLRWLLTGCYAFLLICCGLFVPADIISMAFDSGSATTGPVSVPLLVALGIGLASTAKTDSGPHAGFGFAGLASIGPVMAVAVAGLLVSPGVGQPSPGLMQAGADSLLHYFIGLVPVVAGRVLLTVLPVIVLFLVFQVALLKLPGGKVRRILLGLVYTVAGITIFMTGLQGGFASVGHAVGVALGASGNTAFIAVMGVLLGFAVVCAEPAVWVLGSQVASVSGGHLKRPVLVLILSVSAGLAVSLGLYRVMNGVPLYWLLLTGYGLALLLAFCSPSLSTAVAFDSGAVSVGPVTIAFIIPLFAGVSQSLPSVPGAGSIGVMALIAMAPLISVQLFGMLLNSRQQRHAQLHRKRT